MGEKYYVKDYVARRIKKLIKEKDTGGGKANLANLRRGIGKKPGELPELWGTFLESIPEIWLGKYGIPSREEWAIYIALTMFSFHQQGHEQSMHLEGEFLGKSVRKLVAHDVEGDEERVLRRFNPLVTAADMVEASHHLRGIIQLLSANSIPLDYEQLAEDLLYFQILDKRSQVQLRWGQDFYKKYGKEEGEKL